MKGQRGGGGSGECCWLWCFFFLFLVVSVEVFLPIVVGLFLHVKQKGDEKIKR